MLKGESIDIVSSLRIRIPPAEGQFHERFLNPPLPILEGYNEEIIVWRGSFLQVYSKEGQPVKKLGRAGEGPGEFYVVSGMDKANRLYYFLDVPNKLNIFNKNFDYKKRLFLGGEKSSPIIFDLAIYENTIVAAQRWRTDMKNLWPPTSSPEKSKTISIYDTDGKWLDSFFEVKKGWKIIPDDSILGGRIIIINKAIYFAYQSINCIWKFNPKGDLIKEKCFGKDWWQKVKYTKKDDLKKRKSPGSTSKFYEEISNSGDTIGRIYNYKNHLLLNIFRVHDESAKTFIFLLDLGLEKEEGPLFLEGYHLAGAGEEYLYFTKYLGEYSPFNDQDIEILKCTINR